MGDYFDRDDLLSQGLNECAADWILAHSPWSGEDGQAVIPADALDALLASLEEGRHS